MEHVPTFWLLLAISTGFALVRGGGPERVVAMIFIAGGVGSLLALRPISERYGNIELGVLLVDGFMFAGLLWVALRSRRYWPLWMAALQILELGSHFTELLPDIARLAYGIIISFWSYPMLLILVIGTVRHRIRLSRGLNEAGWVPRG